eukprot:6188371-Pleurochrysis_carterae.AAC.6
MDWSTDADASEKKPYKAKRRGYLLDGSASAKQTQPTAYCSEKSADAATLPASGSTRLDACAPTAHRA